MGKRIIRRTHDSRDNFFHPCLTNSHHANQNFSSHENNHDFLAEYNFERMERDFDGSFRARETSLEYNKNKNLYQVEKVLAMKKNITTNETQL